MISVCIATYNGEKYIAKQLQSILSQLGPEDEIVVSDDGSTDKTIEIIENFYDSRIHIYFGMYHSPIYNFENSINHSKGDVIFLSDQDDIWLPDRVNKLKIALVDNDVIVSNAFFIDGKGNRKDGVYFNKRPRLNVFETIFRNHFFGASMAFRREILQYVLPFPKNLAMHDQWIGLMGCYYGKVGFVSEPLMLYRRHDSNASFNGVSHNPYRKRIMFRFNTIKNFLLRILHIR